MIPSSRDNICHHNNVLIFETIRSCICCRLATLTHNTELQTITADFLQAWLNITDSYLGIIATVPVFPQPSPCLRNSSVSSFPCSRLDRSEGSKNSGELNSHNNMRLSGDRGSNVCVRAGQHEGCEWRLLKGIAMKMTAGFCSCVRSLFVLYYTFVFWQISTVWRSQVPVYLSKKSKVNFLKITIFHN